MDNDLRKAIKAFSVIEGFQQSAASGRLNDAGKAELAAAEGYLAAMSGRRVLDTYRMWRDGGRPIRGPGDDMVTRLGGGLTRDVSRRPEQR